MARQFLFDAWHLLLLARSRDSTDARIAGIAAKGAKEVAYHVERSGDWVIRLGDGTDESHAKMQSAIDELWMYTGEMFAPDAAELALIDAGIAADVRALAAPWRQHVDARARRGDARGAARRVHAEGRQAGRAHRASRAPAGRDAGAAARVSGSALVTMLAIDDRTRPPRRRPRRPRVARRLARRAVARTRRGARSRNPGRVGRSSSASCAGSNGTPTIRRRSSSRVTPTYSGCPATELIATDPRGADGGGRRARPARDAARAGVDHRLDHGGGQAQASRLRHCAADGVRAASAPAAIDVAASVRCAAPPSSSRARAAARSTRAAVAVRLDRVQGAVPLPRLPRAVRLLQAALAADDEQVPSRSSSRRSSARRATRSRSRSTFRRARGAVPVRRGPAPDVARQHRRAGRAPLVLDLLAGARWDAADRGEAQSGRRVLDMGERQRSGRATSLDVMPPMGHFSVPLADPATAALRGLRRRQRHHAAPVDHQDDARQRSRQPNSRSSTATARRAPSCSGRSSPR